MKFENGKNVHIIKLHRYTPGVCKEILPDTLVIAFEQGADRNLYFEKPFDGFSYLLTPSDWEQREFDSKTFGVTDLSHKYGYDPEEEQVAKTFYDNHYYYLKWGRW